MLILFSSPTPGGRPEGEPEPLAAPREHAHEEKAMSAQKRRSKAFIE